ncbi:hypothetical protein [Sphingomonas sp.]|nr:hypothetical protein [Sphingomonas sp.]MBA4763305.1 hypothetical protein [Sphingomonas sp.]
MSGTTIEQLDDAPAALLAWTDPTCTEYAVAELTQFGGAGSFDGIQFS